MLAKKNEYLQEAVSGVRQLTADEQIRQLCQAREDYEYWERVRSTYHEQQLKERDDTIAQQDETISQQGQTIQLQSQLLEEKEAALAAALARIAELETHK